MDNMGQAGHIGVGESAQDKGGQKRRAGYGIKCRGEGRFWATHLRGDNARNR
jgi:hypothetical protein